MPPGSRPVVQLRPPPERLELVCGDCGYGVSVVRPPFRCPMCSGHDWRAVRQGAAT